MWRAIATARANHALVYHISFSLLFYRAVSRKPNISLKMTNVNSGHKRSWDGADHDSHKRPREEPRDWRDVHLKSPSRKPPPPSGRRDSVEKRGGDGRRREHEDYRRSDYRDRGRRDDRDRDERRRSSSRRTNGHATQLARDGDEREEGEISPRHSPAPATTSSMESKATPPPPPIPSKPEPEPEMELDLPVSPPPVEDILAARRAKRLAILAKYSGVASGDATPSPSSAVQPPSTSSHESDLVPRAPSISGTPAPSRSNSTKAVEASTSKRESPSPSPTPTDFAFEQEDKAAKFREENTGAEQISAADYDPSLDRREDEQKRVYPVPDVEAVEEIEEVEEEEVDDMFAVATSGPKKVKKVKKKTVQKPAAPALITTTLDSASDPEGYYSIILGEQLDGRYQVFSHIGKGMFANVVRARIIQGEPGEVGKEVAIKIVRCQESMYRAGLKEVQILNKLKQADPDDKKHIVRLERTFEHRGHLCLVFESMSMNLRDVVKRFGKDVGLNIRAVRAYAHQLFLALSLLRKTNIMHADIKPDNILVNEQKTMLKLCDLGSASDASENDITPYLVSRFYRAPEIILGVPYDPALDIWSIGCTLYELYTGKILFPGRSNNQMILLMMELKGRFNSKMIKKAKFGDMYFDDMGGFESVETDRVTGTNVVRKIHISKPSRDLRARLMPPASVKLKDDENKLLMSFIDLLDKCLALDPSRRITPREALAHPFVRG
ncbi:Serine/threonine-protein kinase prp4 [Hypsizygus marmoreus]|uniref:non-specific serine/threonine protein kinase n=1 Tax=Hypsizygus marmoreus TaxID=39966 RepID=A0A369JF50_HYPMA|nr:Serine/threonine-protein kinase prp4 [Hypsizygus marmoreus]